jgi:hypothetical protein
MLVFAQAEIEPLEAGRAYALTVTNSTAGDRYQLMIDGRAVSEELTDSVRFEATPGRYRLSLTVHRPGEVQLETNEVDVYVSPGPPRVGYRANLAAVDINPDSWPVALQTFDRLVAAGHTDLVLSAGASGQHWQYYVDGFGDDRSAATDYCESFGLTDVNDCYAARVDP